jgi:hypothetical protein
MRIASRKINFANHLMLGTVWHFRGCQVEMHPDGFDCNCKKNLKEACNHITSVEYGIYGVGLKPWCIPETIPN